MKLLALGALAAGILSLLVAAVETLLQVYILHVHPLGFINLAGTFFLMAIAAMCFDRFYGKTADGK